MQTRFKELALAATMLVGLAGPAVAEIRLGATVSETGPASFLGDPEAKTLKLLVERANAAGGIKGEKIRLVLYDDGGDPNKARTFATRLVEEDGVAAIIGGTTTGTSMAVIPVAEVPRCRSSRSPAPSRSSSRCGPSLSRRRTPIAWPARRSSTT